eukprot:TRINITY_DN2928_c0_g1_i1.p1 TRINITY_DN2928_c0_g1~~TRINITY_DN2928_c0_g1_i1.p1  ORF type:complete len:526 (+),score=117.42 TRINITY_DN2928_c0_g1_i1:60-1637(+)
MILCLSLGCWRQKDEGQLVKPSVREQRRMAESNNNATGTTLTGSSSEGITHEESSSGELKSEKVTQIPIWQHRRSLSEGGGGAAKVRLSVFSDSGSVAGGGDCGSSITIRYPGKRRDSTVHFSSLPILKTPPHGFAAPPPSSSAPRPFSVSSYDYRAPTAAELDPQLKRKIHLIKLEILTTEEGYVKGLEKVCSKYMSPLFAAEQKKRSKTDGKIIEAMYASLLNIKACNTTLLNDMYKAIKSANATTEDLSEVDFASVFAGNSKIMRTYAEYIQGCDKLQGLTIGNKDEKVKGFLDTTQRKLEEETDEPDDVSFSSFLITPIQRLVKYRMLLIRLSTFTSDERLSKALQDISDVCQYCNKKKDESDRFAKVEEIQRKTDLRNLVRPGRYFVQEADMFKVTKVDSGYDTYPCHVFLFSDLLVCVKSKSTWGLKKRSFWVQLDDIDVIDDTVPNLVPSSGSKPHEGNGFTIVSQSFRLGLVLTTPAQKAMWIQAVKTSRQAWVRRTIIGKKKSVIGIDLNEMPEDA